jgi:G patch domain-containing protein 1
MAGHDSDSEDYIVVGTPIERELEARAGGSRRPAAVHEPGATKALPVWKQAATDDEGRRRFHGAFTGGFSSGYFNSVGSKEGWAPKAFVSSRSARADAGALRRDARDYMDADELAESEGAAAGALTTREEYDTFGTAAAEAAHAAADRERTAADGERPAVLPGALFHDLVVPVSDPIGARLLRKMGWRVGKGIGRRGAALTPACVPPARVGDAAAGGAAAPPAPPRLVAAVEALRHGAETVLAGDDAEAHDEALGGGDGEGDAPCADDQADAAGVHAEDAVAASAAQRLRRRRRRWGAVAGALADDVKVEVPPAKRDVHGLGFDPFKGAEEFRALKRSRTDASQPPPRAGQAPGKRARAGAFGVGVFEAQDEDVYGGGDREETHFEIAPGSDEDDDEATRFGGRLGGRAPAPRLALGAAPARLALAAAVPMGSLPGFVPAAAPEPPPKVFPPPIIPRGWQPFHKFAAPLPQRAPPPPGSGSSRAGGPPPPPPPPPPADAELALRCDTLAAFVARNGASFEELARTRQRDDPRFAFLFGGLGAEYYAWRCMQLRAAPVAQRPEQRSRPLTAEERGRILGEEPLASAPHGEGMQHGSTAPHGQLPPPPPPPPAPPPPPKGIAAGDRAALLASLGRTFTSETALSGGTSAQPLPQAFGLQPGVRLADKFASGGVELPGARGSSAAASTPAEPAVLPPPVRSKEDWAPEPLLCKRFGVPDPYKGRPRPVERRTFRTDTFALPETAQAAAAAAPKFLAQPVAATPASDVAPVLQLLPPPPPPPPPPSLMALHTASRGAMPPPPPPATLPQPPPGSAHAPDSAALADDFFASLGGPAAPAAAAQPMETAVPLLRPSEKPIDLFKAIFEADDDEDGDEDDEPDALQEAAAGMPVAPSAAAAGAAAPAALLPLLRATAPTPSAPPGAAPQSGPFSALAALAKEHEERRRKEKKAKKHAERDRKHKKKSKKRSEHDRAERKSKKHAERKDKKAKKARKGDASGSASSSSSSSSGDA